MKPKTVQNDSHGFQYLEKAWLSLSCDSCQQNWSQIPSSRAGVHTSYKRGLSRCHRLWLCVGFPYIPRTTSLVLLVLVPDSNSSVSLRPSCNKFSPFSMSELLLRYSSSKTGGASAVAALRMLVYLRNDNKWSGSMCAIWLQAAIVHFP
jgi:hypothetical protein